MADELKDAILDNATGPAEAMVDGVRARQHDLSDQIEAHRYLQSVASTTNPKSVGFRIARCIPPGSLG